MPDEIAKMAPIDPDVNKLTVSRRYAENILILLCEFRRWRHAIGTMIPMYVPYLYTFSWNPNRASSRINRKKKQPATLINAAIIIARYILARFFLVEVPMLKRKNPPTITRHSLMV
jgi:hypothetical protein